MENSKIEWCHHSFNPWWGCCKVNEDCLNCYAESESHRRGHNVWGKDAPRRFFGDDHWRQPEKWNRDAGKEGVRKRVFCASMSDVFEDRKDPVPHRKKLWRLIKETPLLNWLLLTKRPENIERMLPDGWGEGWPNVWLGTSAGSQKRWDEKLPLLLAVNAVVRFVSAEPLLGPLEIGRHRPDWIITGGESGPQAREIRLNWVRDIRDQCQKHGVRFFHKQWGGRDKHAQGRNLDGRTWDDFPNSGRSNNQTWKEQS